VRIDPTEYFLQHFHQYHAVQNEPLGDDRSLSRAGSLKARVLESDELPSRQLPAMATVQTTRDVDDVQTNSSRQFHFALLWWPRLA
jgi:hypothetical protein